MSTSIIARRDTTDGHRVYLWSDGSLTRALGVSIRGAWFKPSESNRQRALRAGWLVLGDVEIYSDEEVSDLARAARWTVERDGLPGTMRARFAASRAIPAMKASWTVLAADARGQATERAWRLPALSAWAGYAVFDFCARGRGRYELMQRYGTGRRERDTYLTTGFRFNTQAELMAHLRDNAPVAVV